MQVSWELLKIAIARTYVIFFADCVLFIYFHVGRWREVLRRKGNHKVDSSFALKQLKVKVAHFDAPNCRKSLKNTESMRTDISNLVLKLKQ